MSDYDIITIGGGLGGAALARSMAQRGARVLVLERETTFKDRVRGEGVTSWGAGEARELGVYDLMLGSGRELPIWENYVGPMQVVHRDVPATTPQGLPTIGFYHPMMQENLLNAAETAGATVRRGVRAVGVTPGRNPSVSVQNGGAAETVSARLVVGVDGRGSLVRKWGGLTETQDDPRLRISGMLLQDSRAPEDTVRLVTDFQRGRASILFPQGNGRVRSYFIYRTEEGTRFQGEKDIPRFIEECVSTGVPAEFFEGATPAGPLATFEGADCYVEHPYRDGVALIGDAAASSDPSWGQGLSLTLRDVRVLRDALSSDGDWDAAGHAYAAEHDRYYGVLHTVEDWFTQFFYEIGPEADERRGRALPLIAEDPTRQPDTIFSGPDHPVSDRMRRRFFGEE